MWSLLLVLVVAVVVFGWRASRATRNKWVRRLSLPGMWHHETADGVAGSLELWGTLVSGGYRLREDGGFMEEGQWRMEGNEVVFEASSGAREVCDLRFFQDGKIGLDGQARPRRVYVKAKNNVVTLRSTK